MNGALLQEGLIYKRAPASRVGERRRGCLEKYRGNPNRVFGQGQGARAHKRGERPGFDAFGGVSASRSGRSLRRFRLASSVRETLALWGVRWRFQWRKQRISRQVGRSTGFNATIGEDER